MNTITNFWRGLSTTGKAIVIAIGVVLIFIIYNYFKNSGAGTNNQNANTQGQYYLIRNEIDLPGKPGTQREPPTGNPPPPQPTQAGIFVRQKGSQSNVAAWDNTHSGVPIRSSPSGSASIVSYLPFGSKVNLQSTAPVTGQSNFGTNTPQDRQSGSTLWYKVNNGYVSSYDLVF